MSKAAAAPVSFEAALEELESIVHSMEEGKLPLEASLSTYQRGVELLRHCQDALAVAEQKIRVLENGSLRDFAGDSRNPD
jgi:exodeoxyribonuclease VII small subunit